MMLRHRVSTVRSLLVTIFISLLFFFFNDTATTEIYTLSLHDALPISTWSNGSYPAGDEHRPVTGVSWDDANRSEEHTSELQSHHDLVCRLLLEKKKQTTTKQKTLMNCLAMPCPRTQPG